MREAPPHISLLLPEHGIMQLPIKPGVGALAVGIELPQKHCVENSMPATVYPAATQKSTQDSTVMPVLSVVLAPERVRG
jgi:hypothetical protein